MTNRDSFVLDIRVWPCNLGRTGAIACGTWLMAYRAHRMVDDILSALANGTRIFNTWQSWVSHHLGCESLVGLGRNAWYVKMRVQCFARNKSSWKVICRCSSRCLPCPHAWVCVCMCLCMCACVRMCVYVCMCMWARAYVRPCVQACVQTNVCARVCSCDCRRVCSCVHVSMCLHVCPYLAMCMCSVSCTCVRGWFALLHYYAWTLNVVNTP